MAPSSPSSGGEPPPFEIIRKDGSGDVPGDVLLRIPAEGVARLPLQQTAGGDRRRRGSVTVEALADGEPGFYVRRQAVQSQQQQGGAAGSPSPQQHAVAGLDGLRITDLDGNPVSHVVKGQRYRILVDLPEVP